MAESRMKSPLSVQRSRLGVMLTSSPVHTRHRPRYLVRTSATGEAMIVKEVAALNVKSCSPDTDLASAAKIMWDCDCGAVPVVNEGRIVVGILTDRDICIAAATRAAAPSQIRVPDVMSKDTAVCVVEDDVLSA